MSKEDELAMSIAEGKPDNTTTTFESHYNHYGSRGYVDLVIEQPGVTTLYEIKSGSAVRNATGANEIIRQATKHANYYFEDNPTTNTKHLTLCFYATPDVWTHIKENAGMYREFDRSPINGVTPTVELRHPDTPAITDMFHPTLGYQTERWSEQLQFHSGDDPLRRVVEDE